MSLKSVMLQLSPEQIEELDRTAKRSGVSRSQVVRDAVDALIDPSTDADVADRYALAYPHRSDGVDDWGDLDAWHVAAREARARDAQNEATRSDW